jgi:flagellar hook-associated protein 3 FlgL
MRVTDAMRLNTALEAEASVSQQMSELSQMAASGLRVSQPSDDPAAYASITERSAQMGIIQARSTAASRATGDLNLAEGTLDEASNIMVQLQQIAVAQANGSEDAAARANAANQVASLRQQLLALANTQGSSGNYLFGGTKTNTPPFDANGVFSGNSDSTSVEIANGVLAVSNANGATAFTAAGGQDIFANVLALQNALSSNNVGQVQASMATLQSSQSQIDAARIDAGLSAQRLQSATTVMSNSLTQLQVAQASEQDADAATTLSNLQQTQVAYEESLQVTKQILSVSLAGVNLA